MAPTTETAKLRAVVFSESKRMSDRMEYWSGHLAAIEREGISTKAYAEREGFPARGDADFYRLALRLMAV